MAWHGVFQWGSWIFWCLRRRFLIFVSYVYTRKDSIVEQADNGIHTVVRHVYRQREVLSSLPNRFPCHNCIVCRYVISWSHTKSCNVQLWWKYVISLYEDMPTVADTCNKHEKGWKFRYKSIILPFFPRLLRETFWNLCMPLEFEEWCTILWNTSSIELVCL